MEDDISDTELVSAAEKAEADANDDTINEAVSDIELCEALDEYERSVKAVPSTMTEFDDISDSELVAAAETNAEIDETASDAELCKAYDEYVQSTQDRTEGESFFPSHCYIPEYPSDGWVSHY